MATVNENVQYTLTLKDFLSGKLGQADAAAKGLESTMGGLKGMLGTLGIGFAVFKGAEFVKDSVEAFHHLEQATAQVEAGLKSTKGAAGMTFDDVNKSAKELAAVMPYSRTALLEMQSVLLTFPSVTKSAFGPASEIIADMSTRLGQDLKSSAIQVGKALQDPIKGVTALRRVGVNFNATQTEMIKNMALSGNMAGAQAAIMKELRVEFEGSARAAAEADPLFGFNKSMGKFKMTIGEAVTSIIVGLKPALKTIGDAFIWLGEKVKTFVAFMKEHTIIVKAAGVAIMLYVVSYQAYAAASVIASTATLVMTAATWDLNAAMLANPVGAVVAAVVTLGTALYIAYQKSEMFRIQVKGLWYTLSGQGGYAQAWAEERITRFTNTLTTNIDDIIEKHKEGKMSAEAFGNGMLDAQNKLKSALGKKLISKEDYEETWSKTASALNAAKNMPAIAVDNATNISPKGATGQKSVTINVSIGKLIESFKVSTTTMKEGANQVEEMVANALLKAINEFQVHASV